MPPKALSHLSKSAKTAFEKTKGTHRDTGIQGAQCHFHTFLLMQMPYSHLPIRNNTSG